MAQQDFGKIQSGNQQYAYLSAVDTHVQCHLPHKVTALITRKALRCSRELIVPAKVRLSRHFTNVCMFVSLY